MEDHRRLRASIRGRLRELTIAGLRKKTERLRKTLEKEDDPKLKNRLSFADDRLRALEGGEFPDLSPRVFLGRNHAGKLGGVLALLYYGQEFDVATKHPASCGFTGNPEEDAALREVIMKDIEGFMGEHRLIDLHRHLTKGCPESTCTWPQDIRSTLAVCYERSEALEEATAELEELRGMEETLAERQTAIDELRHDLDLANRDKDRLSSALAERDKSLEAAQTECTQLEQDNVRLKWEQSKIKTEAEKVIADMGLSLYGREKVARWSKEGKLAETVKGTVMSLLKFYRQEKGGAEFRREALKDLSEEKTRLIERDRAQLRDLGYPWLVNRRDLVRRLRGVNETTIAGLLAYRDAWDTKLGGRTIHQETFQKVAEGLPTWKEDPNIRGIRTLARISGVDRATLRKYHRLGLVDLSWCLDEEARS